MRGEESTMLLSNFIKMELLKIGVTVEEEKRIILSKGEKVYSQNEKYYREPSFDFPCRDM